MNVIDLTQVIEENMPVFPGTEAPQLRITNTIETDGFLEHLLIMYSHTGTHIDAPSHMVEGGGGLDDFPISKFIGKALKLDFKETQGTIPLKELLPYENKIRKAEFLLLNTGWSNHWGKKEYFNNFPALDQEAVDWLLGFRLKGIGVDTISIDKMDTDSFYNHHAFLKNNIVIIENLTNLDAITVDDFIISVLPLKIKDADGSPVRAVALSL